MRVREATPADLPAVMGVLDGAMLAADAGTVRERAAAGDVLVAVAGGEGEGGDGSEGAGAPAPDRDGRRDDPPTDRVLGACVLDARETGAHVDAVAVRRRRRGQGIGTALVDRALAREGRLTADFDADVRPFYDALGFAVRETGDGRFRGVREDG